MINNIGFSNNIYNSQKQNIIKKRYDEIYAHEQAHKSAAGSLGGPIVIDKDSNGIPVGGHVNIKMPVLDKKDPNKTIQQAETVIKSAMAPSDPSNQDFKVASDAKSIKSEANNLKNKKDSGNKLNLIA